MILTTIPLPCKEALEQCRSSPAAAFIREYSGQCRFTPNPDYCNFQADIVVDPTPPPDGYMIPVFFKRQVEEKD